MKIAHNTLDGFVEEIADQLQLGEPPVVRWCIMSETSEDRASAGFVYAVATFMIDGILCEMVIETGLEDAHVSPGRDAAKLVVVELAKWCEQNEVKLRQGRYEVDG